MCVCVYACVCVCVCVREREGERGRERERGGERRACVVLHNHSTESVTLHPVYSGCACLYILVHV